MAAVTVANLKSTTLENALLEVAQLLQVAERATPPDVNGVIPDNVQISVSVDALSVSITANLPILVTQNTSGQMVVTADEYAA